MRDIISHGANLRTAVFVHEHGAWPKVHVQHPTRVQVVKRATYVPAKYLHHNNTSRTDSRNHGPGTNLGRRFRQPGVLMQDVQQGGTRAVLLDHPHMSWGFITRVQLDNVGVADRGKQLRFRAQLWATIST